MDSQIIYTVGGTVQVGMSTYIKRKADQDLLTLCRTGELAFILTSRQIGKSSLMVSTARELEKEQIRSVIIDLSQIGVVGVSLNQWYLAILKKITNTLKLEVNVDNWWTQHINVGATQCLTDFFCDVLLKEVKEQIVLFFDEIDSTLSLEFPSDDFYAALRAAYNARAVTPEFRRLSFVLLGVATPNELIADSKRTPFNIGERVDLIDFTMDEALPLVKGLGGQAEQVLKWIFRFTGGHPYLTQRLCAHLAKSREPTVTEQMIENAVMQLFTSEQAKQDSNLQFVSDMLLKRSPDVRKGLDVYKSIRSGKYVKNDERSIPKSYLKLSGLVRSVDGVLQVRNDIYNTVFDLRWIQKNTPTRKWAQILAWASGIVVFAVLSALIYNTVVWGISRVYVGDFYTTQASLGKLKNLAGLFKLRGVLSNIDYDFQARQLFYDSDWSDQAGIFQNANITADDRQKYSVVVVNGLYITMANVQEGNTPDSSELLSIMKGSLDGLPDTKSSTIQEEITLWLEARSNASVGRYQSALDKYDQAIDLNDDNPATYYERAIILVQLEEYDMALLDLEITLGLAKSLFEEKPSAPLRPISPDSKDYRSKFYTVEDVRNAIDHVIQDNLQNTNFRIALILAKTEVNKYADLESAGLLRTVNELAGDFATQISMAYTQSSGAQTQISSAGTQISTAQTQSANAQFQISTAQTQYANAQAQLSVAQTQIVAIKSVLIVVNQASNCRTGTSTEFSRVVPIPQGESILIIGRNGKGDYLYIQYGQYTCWIPANLAGFVVDPTIVPAIDTPIPPTSPPPPPPPNGETIIVSAPSQVNCASGQTCSVNVNITWRNAVSGNRMCVYVHPELPGQPYFFQFEGTSGQAWIGDAPSNTSFSIIAVSTSSSCGGSSLPPGNSGSATVVRN